jgi:hypothetical protein
VTRECCIRYSTQPPRLRSAPRNSLLGTSPEGS